MPLTHQETNRRTSEIDTSPTVTICMPVYNGKTFLPRAFESLAAQTFKDFEILIVDDGSTDGSAAQAEELLVRHELHGTVIRIANGGPEHARDIARAHAQGKIIAHLDCDDTWDPSYLMIMCGILRSHPKVDLVYCDFIQESDDGQTTLKSEISPWIDLTQATRDGDLYCYPQGGFFKLLLSGQVLFPSCTIYTSELATRTGPYTEVLADVRTSLDWCFGLRASRTGTIAFLNRPLARRYLHKNNISGDLVRTTGSNVRVLDWILSDRTLSKDERRIARARGAMISIWACDITLRVNRRHWLAIKWALTSLRFRFNWKAVRLLALTSVPRFVVDGARKLQGIARA